MSSRIKVEQTSREGMVRGYMMIFGTQCKHLFFIAVSVFCFFVIGVVSGQSPAYAAGACSTCQTYQTALENEFKTHEKWMTNEWWKSNVEKAFKSVSDESRNSVLSEIVAIGGFFDAQNQLAAQRTLQDLTADTLKNYTVSDTICKFGTLSRSLALSESKGKANQMILSKRSQNRQLGQAGMAAANGDGDDKSARLKQFRKDYCDPSDFGSGMAEMCDGTSVDARRNIDINFTRAVDAKNTLNIDLTNSALTDDEADVMALANNLYAHQVFDRINADSLKSQSNKDGQSTFLDQRSIVAKRSVAENSFYNLVGEKSRGGAGSKAYFSQVLQSLGLNATDADKYLGDAPSYDAQMEVLTKKLYQDPAFYASLMESPANVNRQYAALQSFGLMQKRDIYETISRSEVLMSLILEMEIAKYQDNIQNRQN